MKILSSRYAQIGLALIIAVLLITALSSSAAAAGPVYHTVQYGQTLYSIAAHYGTSVWAIACANGIYNPNYVYAGQVLQIPYGGWNDGCKGGYKPGYPSGGHDGCGQCGQDGYDHKGGYDGCNPCGGNAGYHPMPQPKPLGCYYTVRWGDHLYRIALKYGVSWTVIAQANGLYNGNYIYAGQVLRVPCVW
jgi:LysM repeat protein